jgi:hypothetical protein
MGKYFRNKSLTFGHARAINCTVTRNDWQRLAVLRFVHPMRRRARTREITISVIQKRAISHEREH